MIHFSQKILWMGLLAGAGLWLTAAVIPEEAKKPLPRKDCFFGLHFDLHPNEFDTELGQETSEENIAQLLDRVKPDFVQYDCKGHRGYAGYPTKTGSPSPGIVQDALAIWRRVTREHGVGLYIHFSGVWDNRALELHPEWARVDAQGQRSDQKTSTFGPYVDELLIPQLSEAVGNYQLDGVWVDGECWAVELDYSPAALEAWKAETGQADAPKDKSDPRWLDWKNFHRRQFESYLTHWVDELHKRHPGVQITSNWMYTTFAPIPVKAPLDYLSGDYSPGQSVDTARLEARYLASTGMPWDLMAWGFDKGQDLNWSWKTPVHLMQEASVVLMQGGGFQVYYQPTRSGYIPEPIIETAGAVADFCRERQAVSHQSVSIPQVALLLSSESLMDRSDQVFAHWGNELKGLEGALHALLELHYSVDILAEHQLQPRLKEFPLVVLPDTHKLTDEFKTALLDYVEKGGSLLLLSDDSARLFEPYLGVQIEGGPAQVNAELGVGLWPVNANGKWLKVTPQTAQPAGYRFATRDTRKPGEVAATVTVYGQGKIGAVYGPLAVQFYNSHHPVMRQFIGNIVKELFPQPAVTIDGPSCVDLALRETRDGRLALHLMNRANGPQVNRYHVIDVVPAVGPLEVQLRTDTKPKKVSWIPGGERIKWTWKEGILHATIPRLHIHGVLVVDR